jgi:histidine triad (HIT) family protein
VSPAPISRFVFPSLRWAARFTRPLLKLLIGWFFAHMSFALPFKRLRETDTLVAFYHPSPSYPVHILLVPKKAIASLDKFSPAENQAFLVDLFQACQSLAAELGLEAAGYRLILNGGPNQEFPQLHFHLISEER